MTDVPRPEASRRPGLVRFVRDVGVKVLANLLSVPILYLIGVAVGLLPHNRTAIIGALATQLFSAALLFCAFSVLLQRRPTFPAMVIGFIFSACVWSCCRPCGWTRRM
jgi:hypothetical protein